MATNQNYLVIALQLLGSLGLLIYGMRMMSEALQKMAGPGLRHILAKMTTNRVTGMLTGTLVTCAVQSSSASHGNDRLLRLGRTAHAGTGHLSHHGCQHRHDIHGMDYVTGL